MTKDHELRTLKKKVRFRIFLTILSILLVLAAIANAAGLAAGNFLYREFCVLHTRYNLNRFQPLQDTLAEGIRTRHWEDVTIQSRLGYRLKGTYLPCDQPSEKTVIFVHGIAASRLMGLWYAPIYQAAGYNVLLYDSRASGESGGREVTWGYYERYDLDQWVDWVEERHPGGTVGVHGVSMGAATALLHAEMNEVSHRVKFYVADSSYSDLEELLTQQIDATFHLHNPLWSRILLEYSSIVANWQAQFRYQDVSPVRSVRAATTPILYLHGGADLLVPATMSDELATATAGYKEQYIFAGDSHAMAVFNHKQAYYEYITHFLHAVEKQD